MNTTHHPAAIRPHTASMQTLLHLVLLGTIVLLPQALADQSVSQEITQSIMQGVSTGIQHTVDAGLDLLSEQIGEHADQAKQTALSHISEDKWYLIAATLIMGMVLTMLYKFVQFVFKYGVLLSVVAAVGYGFYINFV